MIQGFVDGLSGDGRLRGWARRAEDPEPVPIEVHAFDVQIATARADIYRPDLEQAGIGHGRHGFEIEIPPELIRMARRRGSDFRVLAGGADIGSVRLTQSARRPPPAAQPLIKNELRLAALLISEAETGAFPPKPAAGPGRSASHAPLFAPAVPDAGRESGGRRISAYLDNVRRRHRVDTRFAPAAYAADVDHFYRWYLDYYAASRSPLRAPLARDDLAYLNEPIHLGGHTFPVSRCSLYYAVDTEDTRRLLNLDEFSAYRKFIYWWSQEKVVALGAEDCLVPEYFAGVLRSTPLEFKGAEFPPSHFMLMHRNRCSDLHVLDLRSSPGDRLALYVYLLLTGVRNPGVLRYLPQQGVAEFGDGADRSTLFDEVMSELALSDPSLPSLSFDGLARALRARGFDVGQQRFITSDADGNRLEAARFDPPAEPPVFDVQIIGPFQKLSGLGQACRLSDEIVSSTGLAVNLVDFDLDNPQPSASDGKSPSVLRKSRINILHLNAETVPLAYAYLPDVFSGAYNIGYFFWELNAPATVHGLGLNLLDEVWVSAEYGREAYAPWTAKPVCNVGMAYIAPPSLERAEARQYLLWKIGARESEFIFLASFDAFSFVQRKNPSGAIKAFRKAFPSDAQVKLVLKTHNLDFVREKEQKKIWEEVLEAISADHRLVLLNETLPALDVSKLKAGADCYVSLHRSEGWGFGILEAMRLGVPVICTAYSGNMDFCTEETAFLVPYELVSPAPDDYTYVKDGHVWADPDLDTTVELMQRVRSDKAERERRAQAALAKTEAEFSIAAIAARYERRLRQILAAGSNASEKEP